MKRADKTASRWLLDGLVEMNTRHVFLVPGANISPFLDSLVRHPAAVPVVCTHEQGAGYMADGYARLKGGVGVCAAIGGPGASNLLTAAVTTRLDHSNVLFMTGDVPAVQRDTGAFQDAGPRGTRDRALFRAAVATSFEADGPQLSFKLKSALALLRCSGGGPVHLQLGKDLQATTMTPSSSELQCEPARNRPTRPSPNDLKSLFDPARKSSCWWVRNSWLQRHRAR